MNIIYFAILIHIILLLSIFDIYFKSPIINNVPPSQTKSKPPARRLVLFVADGLRADSLINHKTTPFTYMDTIAPHLSSICKSKGSWGISHTRVPTESRPGHVALAAGFYEDPSAVTKGWKANTVEFDSIFNESAYSWAWGSPDIVPMFGKGAYRNHIYMDYYSPEVEDFSGRNSTTLLDIWVFDKVDTFFKTAIHDEKLMEKLHGDKIIFFMHLLGLDTAGHSHKPHSKEYIENIRVVDDGIKKMEHVINSFYNDEKTAYVFTADHGMTDWGSHGAGSQHETETPFIAWGAGIANKVDPIDMNQADMAPLMSVLIGVPIPVNSVGVLPVEYLNMSKKETANAVFSNSHQITTLFVEKQKRTERDTWKFLYFPFPKLGNKKIDQRYKDIEQRIEKEDYGNAIQLSQELIKLSLTGLDYYQNYFQKMLLACTTMSYIGWMALLLLNMLKKPDPNINLYGAKNSNFLNISSDKLDRIKTDIFFGTLLFMTVFLCFSQNFSIMYYLHCTLPVLLWWIVVSKYWDSNSYVSQKWKTMKNKIGFFFWILFYIIGIEILVLSFFERKILTLSLIGMSVWPYFSNERGISNFNKTGWALSSIALSIFPLLPVVGSSYHGIIIFLGAVLWFILNYMTLTNYLRQDFIVVDQNQKALCVLFNVVLVVSCVNIYFINYSIVAKIGLPMICQMISWFLLVFMPYQPTMGSLNISNRLYNINVALSVPVLLLAVNYEPIFNLILFINSYFWLKIEYQLSNKHFIKFLNIRFGQQNVQHVAGDNKLDSNSIQLADFRRAYFFVMYILLAFFGTGNIASLNSFDPLWVRNFITVFSPFTMALLILIKIVIPFLTVSCTFRAITLAVRAPIRKLFLIVLLIGDIMGLQFLYMVKNEGSWLEIGITISHFVIVHCVVLFLILFYLVSIFLTEATSMLQKHIKLN